MSPTVCQTFLGVYFCAYEGSFTSSNQDFSALNGSYTGPWQKYQTVPSSQKLNVIERNNLFNSQIQGPFNKITGDGFIFDVPLNTTGAQANNIVNTEMNFNNYGDYLYTYARSVTIVTTYFEANRLFILQRYVVRDHLTSINHRSLIYLLLELQRLMIRKFTSLSTYKALQLTIHRSKLIIKHLLQLPRLGMDSIF